MLKHLEKRRQKNEEEGFTLIELMVVVLIMGILMAIAIPTFLSTRGSANDASAKSNATNAYTNEKSYYASNLQFLAATAPDQGGDTLDSTLPWGTGQGQVAAYAYNDTTNNDQSLMVVAGSQSGNCFYIADYETNNGSGTVSYGYAEAPASSGTCAAPGSTWGGLSGATFNNSGSAGGSNEASAGSVPKAFFPSWN